MDEKFEKWIEFSPSRNWIREPPSENYGITTVKISFYFKGAAGAVQWVIGTEWGIEPVRKHLGKFSHRKHQKYDQLTGFDLGYHSPKPMYEGQLLTMDECPVINGPCYYDGSSLSAYDPIEGFLARGTDWLWPKLEQYYRCQFEDGEYPDFSPEYLPHPAEALS